MKHTLFVLVVAAACGSLNPTSVRAQERRPGVPPGGLVRTPNPLVTALDTNKDGVIDENEIANAPVALKKMDKNGDGKLTEDELRPAPPLTGVASASEQMVMRLMQYDKNGDGKLSKEELPERMQSFMARADADKDGFLTKDEIRKMTESNLARPAAREGREGGDRPVERPAPPK